jgi:RHS repeat-associated protein
LVTVPRESATVNAFNATPSFVKSLSGLTSTPHVESDGPTVGPNGIEIPYELPPCTLPNGKPGEIGVFLDYKDVQIVYGSGLTGYAQARFIAIELYEEPSVGVHQLSFACYPFESPEPGGIFLGPGEEWSAPATWKDNGFQIEVTGPAEPVWLSTHISGPGYLVTTSSGAPAGPHPCPTVPGSPWTAVNVALYVASFDYNVPSKFVYEERYSLLGSTATSWPVPIPANMEPGSEVFVTVECSHLTSGPGAFEARFLYNWDERYGESLIRLTAPVGGALASWETYGGRNPAESSCVCSEGWSGDPVNTATGEYSETDTDATIKGVGEPLQATRTYASGRHEIDGPFGYGWSSAYMPQLEVSGAGVTVSEESGAEVRYEAKEGKYMVPPRVNATLVKNEDGTYTFTTREPGHHLAYTFSEAGRLQSITEPDGVTVTVEYPSESTIVVTNSGGRSLTYTLSDSHVTSVTDANGATTSYEYDSEGNLAKVTDPLGRATVYTYDGSHQLLSRVDPRGGRTENTYSPSGQVVKQTDPMGRATKFAYETEPDVTLVTSPSGVVTRYAYEFGFMKSKTVGYGSDEEAYSSYEYDPVSGGETNIDGQGIDESRTLDAEGNVLTRNDEGLVTKYTYNPLGEVTSETDGLGTTTSYEYNSGGELLSKTTPLGEGGPVVAATWTYGSGTEAGEMLTSIDPDSQTTHYGYDSAGDLTSVTDPLDHKTTMSYDADGRLHATTTPNGNVAGGEPAEHTITNEYDADGELLTVTDGLGGVTHYSYNEDGQQTSVEDPSGRTTSYAYDLDGERTSVKYGDEPASKTSYNEDCEVTAQEDPSGNTTTFQYNALGYRTAATVGGSTTKTTYDDDGQPREVQLPTGRTTYYQYDDERGGRLQYIQYSDGTTPVVENTYDADGRRTAQRTSSAISHYVYDALGRLTSETDGAGKTTSYEYDADGHVTKITYPNGKTVKRVYNADGQLTQVEDWLGHKIQFAYDADGNQEQEKLPGGGTSSSSYDADDDLTEITDVGSEGLLANFAYQRDKAGRLTSGDISGALTASATYSYDQTGRLQQENESTFAYDPSGNATGYVAGSTQDFNPADELTSSDAPGVPIAEPPEPPHEEPEPPHEEHGGHEPPPEVHEEHHETKYEPPYPVYKYEPPHLAYGGSGTPDGTTVTPASHGVLSEKIETPRVIEEDSTHVANAHGALTRRLTALKSGTLLVAFVSVPAGSRHVVFGGTGLRWHVIISARDHGGSVLIATARAVRALSGASAWEHGLSPRAPGLLSVVEFAEGAQIQAVNAADGRSGAPSVKVAGGQGATIWAVGHDTQRVTARTPGTTLSTHVTASGGSSWVQHQLAQSSGITNVVDDQPPSTGAWALAAIAVETSGASAARLDAARQNATTPAAASAAGAAVVFPTIATTGPTATKIAAVPTAHEAVVAAELALPTRTFTYDAAGDRSTESVEGHETHFSYDQAGRLVSVGRLAAYTYDGDGLRTSKTVNGTTTDFTWQHAESLPMLLQAGNTYYIYGPTGAPVEQITEETPTYLLQDEQGSTRLLTNDEGKLTGTYSYDAWGNPTAHTGTATTSIQFDGQYVDEETGYEYLRGRYYDPSTGQFLTPDPGYATTLARYAYAEDDPVNAEDPSGLWCVLGHDPNGACRGSNLGNDVHAVGTTAAVTGIVAGVVIVSVGTGGIADEVAADAAVVGLAADGVGAYNACASAPDPWSRQCAVGIGQVALDYGTFGLGSGLGGAAAGYYGVATGLAGYGYSQWAQGADSGASGGGVYGYCRGATAFTPLPSGQPTWQSSYGSYLEP